MKLFQFRNWPMFNKIMFVGLSVALLFVLSTFFVLIPKTVGFLTDEKKTNLENLIQVAEDSRLEKWQTYIGRGSNPGEE